MESFGYRSGSLIEGVFGYCKSVAQAGWHTSDVLTVAHLAFDGSWKMSFPALFASLFSLSRCSFLGAVRIPIVTWFFGVISCFIFCQYVLTLDFGMDASVPWHE